MAGAVVRVPLDRARELLPAGLVPVRVSPRTAAVTLLSVEYPGGGEGTLDPYDEFGILVHCVPAAAGRVPTLSALAEVPTDGPWRLLSGYFCELPVTTGAAREMGVEQWGFPKFVADVDHEDRGGERRTVVSADGERFVSMAVEKPPTVHSTGVGYGYSVCDGTLLRERVDVDGEVGVWPLTDGATCTFGPHPRGRQYADLLDTDDRALCRFYAETELRLHAGKPL